MEIKRRRNEKKMRKERQRLELQSDGLTDTAGIIDQSVSLGYSNTDCDYGNTDRVPWLVLREILHQNLLPLPSSVPVDPDLDMSHVTGHAQLAKRTLALSSQRWICAGCGILLSSFTVRSFNFLGGAKIF